MKSGTLGKNISGAEVTTISKHGFWLLLANQELFVPFKTFPWFKDASVEEILNVEWPQPHHLYWPALDIDLAVASIQSPEKFPLVSKVSRKTKSSNRRTKLTRLQPVEWLDDLSLPVRRKKQDTASDPVRYSRTQRSGALGNQAGRHVGSV